jgi:hypothetical protein
MQGVAVTTAQKVPRPPPTPRSLSLHHLPLYRFPPPSFVFYTSCKIIPFDFIAEKDAQDAEYAFLCKFVEAKHEIVSFVNSRLGWNKAGEFLNYFRGSFNLSIAVRNNETNECVLIRFPLLGKVYEPWREKKVKNEVMIMNYLSEYTSIPIPRVYHGGCTKESP